MGTKMFAILLHFAILGVLSAKYGAHSLDHPVACVFAGFSCLVIVKTMFTK